MFFGPKHNKKSTENKTPKSNISPDLKENQKLIKETLGDSEDVIIRRFKIDIGQVDAFVLYIDGMTDKTIIADHIIKPLTESNPLKDMDFPTGNNLLKLAQESLLSAGDIQITDSLDEVLPRILAGDAALFIMGAGQALIISANGFENRGVQRPETEVVIKGPQEGFSEPLRINTTLIRRKINNSNLRIETLTIGRQTKTKISLAYIKGISNEKIVAEVKARLNRIDTDSIMGAGFIESFIEDSPLSPFPTVNYTERPDVAAARILEGRIAIIVDGTPIVLTVPHLFVESFQTAEDYLNRAQYMTLVRWFRFLAFFITIFLPSIYIALVTFHLEMIPTSLLISIAASKEGTPFPAFLEAFGMGITFELLREAGIRMPRPVGQAVSIVGALVIGEAAVSAGLVGAPMVIITAITAITSFIVPTKTDVSIILRLGLTIAADVAGFYGIMMVTFLIIIHVASLRSFGIPYLSPLAPLSISDLKDVLIKVPTWAMKTRPRTLAYANWRRQGEGQKPGPKRGKKRR